MTPTPGQPLSEADVSLLQPGDLYLRSGAVCRHVGVCADEDGPHGLTGVDLSDDGFFYNVPIRHFTFLGRPDQDGWIAHEGQDVPVREILVDVKKRDGAEWHGLNAGQWGVDWIWADEDEPIDGDIIAYRPHAPVSRPGDGVDGLRKSESIHDAARRLFALEYPGRDYDSIDASARVGWMESAWEEREAALIPPAEPVSRPAGEGEREAVAREIAAEWVAMARKATPPTGCFLRYVPISEGEINALEDLLRPAVNAGVEKGSIAHQIEMAVVRETLRNAHIPNADQCGKDCDCTADCERSYQTPISHKSEGK